MFKVADLASLIGGFLSLSDATSCDMNLCRVKMAIFVKWERRVYVVYMNISKSDMTLLKNIQCEYIASHRTAYKSANTDGIAKL